jgi:hypothetical protein
MHMRRNNNISGNKKLNANNNKCIFSSCLTILYMCQCGQHKGNYIFAILQNMSMKSMKEEGRQVEKNCFGYCLHIVVIIKIYINFWLLLDVGWE